jgi:plasmid replication initiation protein
VVLGFSPGILSNLSKLNLMSEFTRYRLGDVADISSFYGWRLYELCDQYRTPGKRTIKIERLRQLLGVGDKYALVEAFQRCVVNPSVTEVSMTTDLTVSVKPVRERRKIVAFNFKIKEKAAKPANAQIVET